MNISLTQEIAEDLERTQKTFAKLVLGQKYNNYNDALIKLNILPLDKRREYLCLKFAQSGLKNQTLTDLMKPNEKKHPMETRNTVTHKVENSNTARYGRSSVPYMQNLLNKTS